MNDTIPALTIEQLDPSNGDGLIVLEQDSCGNVDRVAIHPLHVRHLAEKFGLVSTCDLDAARTIATMTRRMRLLAERVQHLNDWLHEHSDTRHADFTYEQSYSQATADLATEFCHELDERFNASNGSAEQGRAPEQGSLL